MADDPRAQQLLDRLLEANETPEEVCSSCPELLPVVRDRWRQVRRLRADRDALFPPPDGTMPEAPAGAALPHVPGYEVEAVLGRGPARPGALRRRSRGRRDAAHVARE